MRLLVTLLLLSVSCGIVKADFYQNNNPFPTQVRQEELTNIYATDPVVMQKEIRTEKKMGWWNKKNEKTDVEQIPEVNEGIQNGSFYVFPANK